MWIEHFILPALFLLASSALYAIRLALENAGLISSREELNQHRKYYAFFHVIQKSDRSSQWSSLFDFVRLTNQITRLVYTITSLIYFLKNAQGILGYSINNKDLQVTAIWVIAFFFVILLLQLIVDLLFSLISRSTPIKALRVFAWFATPFLVIFSPIVLLVLKATRLLKKKKNETKEMSNARVKEKLLEFVQETEIKTLLSPLDRKLLVSVASFQERVVREVMIPRIDVFSVPADRSIYDCVEEFIEEGYSRIPVYEDDIDHVIGILLFKDLLTFYAHNIGDHEIAKTTTIKEFIKPAIFTPETKKISHLLQEFRNKHFHLAIVVDEYGGTEGIITIEDILEELVGEIEDEYDEGEDLLYIAQPDGGWIVDGKMSVIDIEQELQVNIPSTGEYETIGGYIFHRAGAIPKKGWRIHQDNFYIEVVKSDEKSIEKVRIIPTLSETQTVEDENA
ncbi:MAG: hemolysin family protein [Rhabdochlamydiaceae bacterium]|nr:hemolysin family protein [Candidatus Amphrikana amoebophyrae]